MSAKKTADAALAVSEEALNRVYSIERGSPVLLLTVILVLGYLFYLNYFIVEDPKQSSYILKLYHNNHVRMAVISLIVLGMSGVFGFGFSRLSAIIGFSYMSSYLIIRNIYDSKENMEDMNEMSDSKLSDLQKKLSDMAGKMYKSRESLVQNKTDMAQKHSEDRETRRKSRDSEEKVVVQPDIITKESMEPMSNFPLSRPEPRCTPCQKGSRSAFNPRPFEPDSPLMGIGNDNLPPMGVDFLSAPPGVYSQSQIAYEMGMS